MPDDRLLGLHVLSEGWPEKDSEEDSEDDSEDDAEGESPLVEYVCSEYTPFHQFIPELRIAAS